MDKFSDSRDAQPAAGFLGAEVMALPLRFNGATWDRLRNNVELTLLASAVRAADNNTPDQVNYNHRGVIVVVDMTVVPGVDIVTPKIQGKDPVSGKYYDILAGVGIVAVSTVVLRVFNGITVTANLAVSDLLPRTWRLFMDHSAATNFTYSAGGILLL